MKSVAPRLLERGSQLALVVVDERAAERGQRCRSHRRDRSLAATLRRSPTPRGRSPAEALETVPLQISVEQRRGHYREQRQDDDESRSDNGVASSQLSV